jgi:hypothetical protein
LAAEIPPKSADTALELRCGDLCRSGPLTRFVPQWPVESIWNFYFGDGKSIVHQELMRIQQLNERLFQINSTCRNQEYLAQIKSRGQQIERVGKRKDLARNASAA